MNIWDGIRAQRAVREFDGTPADDEAVDRILEAARRAPSSKNEQRWAFVVVRDRERLARLARVGDYAQHAAGAAFAIAFVTPTATEDWQRESIAFDLGQSVQNAMLAAWELGLGSVHGAVYDEDATREIIRYPDGWRCDYFVSFGVPAAPRDPSSQGEPDRKPIDGLRHDEAW